MENKELILAMAEFMGYEKYDAMNVTDEHDEMFIIKGSDSYCPFRYNPLTNGTQLNEFIEKAKMDVCYNQISKEWSAVTMDDDCNSLNFKMHKDRDTSSIKCAAAMLGVEYEV